MHLSKRIVLNLDINSYFKSIDKKMVQQVFRSLGASDEIAGFLAAVCTCRDYLVPGTVCAPVISNLVFVNCDKDLLGLASQTHSTYTRYVDDITFSGETIPSIKEIDKVLDSHGFLRNDDKTFYQYRGSRQYVTGLTVFDKTIPRIPKWKKKDFRQKIFYMKKYGIKGHLNRIGSEEGIVAIVNRFDGLISFYSSIEPHFISKYVDSWEQIKEDWLTR